MNKSTINLFFFILFLIVSTCICYAETYSGQGFWHTISWGETLFEIASRYGVDPNTLARTNNIYNWNRIYVGQKLWISRGEYIEAYVYTVKKGDFLYKIAGMFGVSIYEIASLNNLYNLNLIYEGQVLYIPVKKG
jgi:LysM repeat protein